MKPAKILWLLLGALVLALSATSASIAAPATTNDIANAADTTGQSEPARHRADRPGLVHAIPGKNPRLLARAAGTLLPRPEDGGADPFGTGYTAPSKAHCAAHVCVHWVASTNDAPPLEDFDANGVPDQVELVAATAEEVWATVVGSWGFRSPKSDLSTPRHGPDGRLDIYLADIGTSLYGYTATDDPNASVNSGYLYWDVSTYLVLDDDYSPAQFGDDRTPLELLQVSVAHEFFHAVQAAYDFWEDPWLLEGQATAVEDELFDDVNDLYVYLGASPLAQPDVPLDIFAPDHPEFRLHPYGTWIYWRYLAERFGGFPAVVRAVWEHADGAPGGPDDYSLVAIDRALTELGSSFRGAFRDFAAAATAPTNFFEEGASYLPVEPDAAFTLSPTKRGTGTRTGIRDHLASAYVSIAPGKGVRADAKLRLQLTLPPPDAGTEVAIVIRSKNGSVRTVPVRLQSNGRATLVVARFGRMEELMLVLSNASTRTECWSDQSLPAYSCFGIPEDDERSYTFKASLVT